MKYLPGIQINKVSVFDLNIGAVVYDKATNRLGIVSSIKETAVEYIEAFVKLEGDDAETPAWKLKNCVML